jgi:hypothetical protein
MTPERRNIGRIPHGRSRSDPYGPQGSERFVENGGDLMPRYMVERTFPEGLAIPINDDGVKAVAGVIEANRAEDVTWVHSYVSADKHKTYCIYDAPSPEAIRKVAGDNQLPVDGIVEVRVLDPYFYR